jgi:AraC-like DNA-binding protein
MPRAASTIGETRHAAGQGTGTSVVVNAGVGPPRGILRRHPPWGDFWHSRTVPPESLRGLVEHFWSVRWDLTGLPSYDQETLPHPCVHIVLEEGTLRIFGPQTARFARTLAGRSGVFGIKFKPAGFHPFLGRPVVELANASLPLSSVFGVAAEHFELTLRAASDDAARITIAVEFLQAHWPPADPAVEQVNTIVASIVDDRTLNSVAALVARVGRGQRALQRWFERYVGVSPKWVISRYRLHDAVEQLAQCMPEDWAAFALHLGYFDQAHFIRDFKALVGRSPREFALAESASASTRGAGRAGE